MKWLPVVLCGLPAILATARPQQSSWHQRVDNPLHVGLLRSLLPWPKSESEDTTSGDKIVPRYVGRLNTSKAKLSFSAPCFQTTSAWLDGTTIRLEASGARSFDCIDYFFFSDRETYYTLSVALAGSHTVELDSKPHENSELGIHGMLAFVLQESLTDLLSDLYHIQDYYRNPDSNEAIGWNKATLQSSYMKLEFSLRPDSTNKSWVRDVLPKYLQTGDCFWEFNLNVKYPAMMMLENGWAGHAAMFMRDEDDGMLYVVESDGSGIHATEYTAWYDLYQADPTCPPDRCAINIATLSPAARAVINTTAVFRMFKDKFEGLPYGYPSLFFANTDSRELAPPFVKELYTAIFSFDQMGDYIPALASKFYMPGLNKRLGLPAGTNMTTFFLELDMRGLDFWDVVTMPELDKWTYDETAEGASIFCSGLVIRLLRAGGVFGGIELQGTEFTPKDSYQLAIFDADWPMRVSGCAEAATSAARGYCQIMGKIDFRMPGFNTIAPYHHMNERCSYRRLPDLC